VIEAQLLGGGEQLVGVREGGLEQMRAGPPPDDLPF
jgi:hypothetical protein